MPALPGTSDRRRLFLMRHGHVDYFSGVADIHQVTLTRRGKSEAEAAGKAFAHVHFDRAICSGLPRTRETAEAVLSGVEDAPELEIDADLVELRGGGRPDVKSRARRISRAARFLPMPRPAPSAPSIGSWHQPIGTPRWSWPMKASTA